MMELFLARLYFCLLVLGFMTLDHQNYINHGVMGCLEEEKIGLLNLREAYDYLNGSSLSSWGEDVDCCAWEDVTCDPITTRVSRLSILETVKLGYLNFSLLNPFQELKNLSLPYNSLTGFTGELNLTKLERLDFSSNQLTQIPLSFIAQKSLRYLNVRSNSLTDLSSFEGFSTLTALEVLNLAGNNITGSIPSSIGTLTALKALSFGTNRFVNISLPEEGLCKLTNLEELDLSRNRLSGLIPPCLSKLTSLKLLALSHNGFVGTIPSTLFSDPKSLEYVSLSNNHFEGSVSLSSFGENSKLELFELDSLNADLRVYTEDPHWTPQFQLKVVSMTNCKLNEPTGALPDFLKNQHELMVVNLSYTGMVGTIPSWILMNNTNLESVSLQGNLLQGPFLLDPNKTNFQMFLLDVSNNRIDGQLPNMIGSVVPNLLSLDMSNNLLQGTISPSLGEMRLLNYLDLSNNNFSGEIPEDLAIGCRKLRSLRLSSNNLRGPLLPATSNLNQLFSLYLDNNHFSGELSPTLLDSPYLGILDISNNTISGEIPHWFGNISQLFSLVMSNNSFIGHVPDSFCELKELNFLALSRNHFRGLIPSCFNASSLKYLHLQGNEFMGPLPHVFLRSNALVTLDVSDNQFSGGIPDWMSSLSSLRVLLLKNNNLGDSVPSKICKLENIRIMDLSSNNFSGSIPSCLYQTPFGSNTPYDDTFATNTVTWTALDAFSRYTYESSLNVNEYAMAGFQATEKEEEVEFMSKRRFENYRGNPLYYMSGIDLSQNKLTGSIPDELGYLTSIHTLNLSHNHLSGSIPTTFSNLSQIQSLDLSYNSLSGRIPQELTQLNFLAVFSVAHNNLSGRIPDGTGQFDTFDQGSYAGNPLLCGPQLVNRSCNPHEPSPSDIAPHSSREKNEFLESFLWSFLVFYVTAFSAVTSLLYYCPSYRRRLFKLVDGVEKGASRKKPLKLRPFARK